MRLRTFLLILLLDRLTDGGILARLARAAESYALSTVAGSSYAGDGRYATQAILLQPEGLAFDRQGNLYIADAADHRVRKVFPNGMIATVAGIGLAGAAGDFGPAAAARLSSPYDVCVDGSGNLFIADLGNSLIRRVDPDGAITTIAGGSTGERLQNPRNLIIDGAGNLFFSDFGSNRVGKIGRDGTMTWVAGTGEAGYSGDGGVAVAAKLAGPAGLALDAAGNLYIADSGNRRVRRISGQTITTVQDRHGKAVEFSTPTSVGVDVAGILYVADGSAVITTIDPLGEVATLPFAARSLTISAMGIPYAVAGTQVSKIDRTVGAIPVAGSGKGAFAGDGSNPAEWRFHSPTGVAAGSDGTLYIADTNNGRVRKLTPGGELSTLLFGLKEPRAVTFDVDGRLYIAEATQIRLYNEGGTRPYSFGTDTRPFANPSALAFGPDGMLYVADTGNNLIRKVAVDGSVTVVAGGGVTELDANPLRARLKSPAGIAFDSDGTLWISEAGAGRLRRLDSSGRLSVVSGPVLKEPRGIRLKADGKLIVCDVQAHRLIEVARDGAWSPIAGSGDVGYVAEEREALRAPLGSPADVAIARDGTMVFADSLLGRIFRLTPVEDKPEPGPAPITLPTVDVVHAATQKENAGVAPGQLVILRGEHLADVGHLAPVETEVKFGMQTAVVLAVDPARITVQVPPGATLGFTEVLVTHRGAERARGPVEIAARAPGLFTAPDRQGDVLAVNEDGTINSVSNPAPRGSIITIYGTGAPGNAGFRVEIGPYNVEVVWSGSAPGLTGLFQLNVRTPAGFAPSGVQKLTVSADGVDTGQSLTLVTR